jgi:hypothetical protein
MNKRQRKKKRKKGLELMAKGLALITDIQPYAWFSLSTSYIGPDIKEVADYLRQTESKIKEAMHCNLI